MYKDVLEDLGKFDIPEEEPEEDRSPKPATTNALRMLHKNTIMPPQIGLPFYPKDFSLDIIPGRIDISIECPERWTRVIPIKVKLPQLVISFRLPARLPDGSYYDACEGLMVLVDKENASDTKTLDIRIQSYDEHKTYRKRVELKIKVERHKK